MATTIIAHERDLRDFLAGGRDNSRAAGVVAGNVEINPFTTISWVTIAILRRALCI
jgi:hypothetical protein